MEWQGAHHRSRYRVGYEGKVRKAKYVQLVYGIHLHHHANGRFFNIVYLFARRLT